MKLHFESLKTLVSTPPTKYAQFHNLMFCYTSPNIFVFDIQTGSILKQIKFEDIQILKIHNNILYICTSDVFMINLNHIEMALLTKSQLNLDLAIQDCVKMSKSLINHIEIFEDEILVSKLSKMILLKDKKIIKEIPTVNFPDGIFLGDFLGFYDLQKIAIYNRNFKVIYEGENKGILDIKIIDDKIYWVTKSSLVRFECGTKAITETTYDHEWDLGRIGDSVQTIKGDSIYDITLDGNISNIISINQCLNEYSGGMENSYELSKGSTVDSNIEYEDGNKRTKLNSVKYSEENDSNGSIESDDSNTISEVEENDSNLSELEENDSNLSEVEESGSIAQSNEDISSEDISEENIPNFEIINKNILKTSENDFIFHESFKIFRIYSFVDDVTDCVNFNGFVILVTASGTLKYSNLSSGQDVLDSRIIKISSKPVNCCKLKDNLLFLGCKDKSVKILEVQNDGVSLQFKLLYIFKATSNVVAVDFNSNIFAFATSDHILQIFKGNSDLSSFQYFNSLENISTMCIHSKSITSLLITNDYVITTSLDKSCKVFDLNGLLIKTLQSDKILNSCYSSMYLAICSHKAIKVFHYSSLTLLSLFQCKKPVLSSYLYNGYLLAMSDVLRVYDLDKKKCVKSYDLSIKNCWGFKYPYLAGENKIIMLDDISVKVHQDVLESIKRKKEETILIDKSLKNKDYESVIKLFVEQKNDKNYSELKKYITKGYYSLGNLEFMESYMKNGDHKAIILNCFIQVPGFKHCEIFNILIKRYGINKLDKQTKDKIRKVVKKHSDAVEELYTDYLGLGFIDKIN